MIKTLTDLFTPSSSNNYKAKTLHLSSLSIFMIIVMVSQLLITLIGKNVPGVLGIASSITVEELIDLTNQKREEHGLSELKLNQTLVEAARQKGADMIVKGYWAHTSPDGKTPWYFFKNVSYQYLYAGENLARDFVDSPSVVVAWMNSPTHRDNILSSRYRDVGIAVIQDTFQGQETTLVVQMFGTQAGAVLPSRADKVGEAAETVEVELAQLEIGKEVTELKSELPVINSFQLTKSMSVGLISLLIVVFAIDVIIVTKKRIVRLSGDGLGHLIFLGILLVVLLAMKPGIIL